ncbi:MAG: ArsA family ATPase [Deltaproteobacteria bacterium]|nr:ArsA family ATPase [Deltaproteobacteria bacterium]
MTALSEILSGRKVIACVGSGGVGKTTTAATLALRAAVEGKRALVLTIDPARRLANSLGLEKLGNRETQIDLSPLRAIGVAPKGALWAMMLDQKLAWDDLVQRDARSESQAKTILENRLYKTLSTVLAGSLEYMAMERVYEFWKSQKYDVVVLDTPPTSNALDFLSAPDRLMDFLDNDAMRLVLGPMLKAGKVGLKLFALPSSIVLKTLARFTGADFLRDVADFLIAFEGMYDAFKARAAAVKAMLASKDAGFVLVTSPNALTIDEAVFFHETLKSERIATQAVVVNRVQRDPHRFGGASEQAPIAEALQQAQIADAARAVDGVQAAAVFGEQEAQIAREPLSVRLAQTLHEQSTLADVDKRQIERLRLTLGQVPLFAVPRLRKDVHDLSGLWQIDEHLRG